MDPSCLSKLVSSHQYRDKTWPLAPAGLKRCWMGNCFHRCCGTAAIHSTCTGKDQEDLTQQGLLGAPKLQGMRRIPFRISWCKGAEDIHLSLLLPSPAQGCLPKRVETAWLLHTAVNGKGRGMSPSLADTGQAPSSLSKTDQPLVSALPQHPAPPRVSPCGSSNLLYALSSRRCCMSWEQHLPIQWWKQDPTPGPCAHPVVPVGASVAAELFLAPRSCPRPLVPAAPGPAVGSSHHPVRMPEPASSCLGTSWGQGQHRAAPSPPRTTGGTRADLQQGQTHQNTTAMDKGGGGVGSEEPQSMGFPCRDRKGGLGQHHHL